MRIEKCPKCGSQAIHPIRLYTKIVECKNHTSKWVKLRWQVYCLDCGWESENALTERGAWRKWNREAKRGVCVTCRKYGRNGCPYEGCNKENKYESYKEIQQ